MSFYEHFAEKNCYIIGLTTTFLFFAFYILIKWIFYYHSCILSIENKLKNSIINKTVIVCHLYYLFRSYLYYLFVISLVNYTLKINLIPSTIFIYMKFEKETYNVLMLKMIYFDRKCF